MPDKAKDPESLPLGSGLLGGARSALLNRKAQLDAAEGAATRVRKQAEKDARKASYVPK